MVAVEIVGVEKKVGKRKKETYSTMIRAGDEGAKKKLEKATKKHLSGELNDWSMEKIINWTVAKSKEIERGRNRKDNPNGWSPLTRVMRLRAKLVGAVHKRLEKGLVSCSKKLRMTQPVWNSVKKKRNGSKRMEYKLICLSGRNLNAGAARQM